MDFNKEAVEAVADANANFGNALLKVFHRTFLRKFKNIDIFSCRAKSTAALGTTFGLLLLLLLSVISKCVISLIIAIRINVAYFCIVYL